MSTSKSKQHLINKILAIVNGEIPAKRSLICIDWGFDHENTEDWSVFLVDGKLVTREKFAQYAEQNKNGNDR